MQSPVFVIVLIRQQELLFLATLASFASGGCL